MSDQRGRLRIGLVAHDVHDHGGMERAFAELVRRAHDRYEFVVISAELATDLQPLVEWRRIRIPRRPVPLRFALFFVFAGIRLALARVDVVHTLGALVPNRADIATVQFCHAGFRERRLSKADPGKPLLRRLNTRISRALGFAVERWFYGTGRADALAPVSEGVASELRRHYPNVPVAVTPNGVDVHRYRPNEKARRQLRTEEGTGPDDIIALFVGGDWDHKGLAIAIEGAADAAARSAGSLRLWVVGRGDQDRFGALATQFGIGGAVHFFGLRSDTERFYQAADIFVLPTLYETFSIATYEAAASGLPVVATRVSGIADLVRDDAGFLVDRTPDQVAEALYRLISDPPLRRSMGEAGRRRAQMFTWDRSVGSVLALYSDQPMTRELEVA
jgi:glycosyltransferase involved in cell wall biosynthesis